MELIVRLLNKDIDNIILLKESENFNELKKLARLDSNKKLEHLEDSNLKDFYMITKCIKSSKELYVREITYKNDHDEIETMTWSIKD